MPPHPKQMRISDFCCGTGAMSLAFGGTVFANDNAPESKVIFCYNHNTESDVFDDSDIHDLEESSIPPHDILCAGFPCQPFSIAGKQKGKEDHRSNVFWKLIQIIKYHKPKAILLENVKNLESHDHGNTFRIIRKELEMCGYHIKYRVIDTSTYSYLPHHRERIYIVCFRDIDAYNKFSFDGKIAYKHEPREFRDFLETDVDIKYYYKQGCKIYDALKESVVSVDRVYQYRRYYVREIKSGLCPTLTANMGTGGHNVPIIIDDRGIRKLTPRECFNLQGFPSTYVLPPILSDAKLYKLAGNSVSLPIVSTIALRMTRSMQ